MNLRNQATLRPQKNIDHAAVSSGAQNHTKLSVVAIIYVILLIVPIQFNLGTIYLSGTRVLLLVMFIPLFVNLFAGKYGPIVFTDIAFFLHIAWGAIALTVNDPQRVVQQIGSLGLEFLGSYLLARAYVRNSSDFIALIKVLFLALCVTIPFAIYESASGQAMILETVRKLPGISSYAVIRDPNSMRLGLFRAQVIFAHPIHYGLFASAMFALVFVGLKGSTTSMYRYRAGLVVLLATFLSLSSGGLLSLILQMGLITWAWLLNGIKARWLLLLLLFVIFYIIIDLLSNRTPYKVFMSYATFSAQTAYWRALINDYGFQNVWANPFFGLGLSRPWVRPPWMYSASVDNFWLYVAMTYGIPSVVFIVSGYFTAIWKISQRKFDGDLMLWHLRRAWVISFVGLSFTLWTVHVWETAYAFVFFLFGSGIWMLNASPDDERQQVAPAKTNRAHLRSRKASSNQDLKATVDEVDDGENARLPLEAHQRGRNNYTRFTKPPRNRSTKN